MPEYSFTDEEGEVMVINSSTGIATYKGRTFRKPCTLHAENGRVFMKVASRRLLESIDYSTIEMVESNCYMLTISFPAPLDLYLLDETYEPNSLPGNRRIRAPSTQAPCL